MAYKAKFALIEGLIDDQWQLLMPPNLEHD